MGLRKEADGQALGRRRAEGGWRRKSVSSRATARDLLERHRSQSGHDAITDGPSLTLGMTGA